MYRHRTTLLSATGLVGATAALTCVAVCDSLPPDASYRPLPTQPFSVVRSADEAQKPTVMQRQATVLQMRYDLSNQPMPGVFMSGG
jgi:cytochrome c peroxidase